jgi:hypothetical protein
LAKLPDFGATVVDQINLLPHFGYTLELDDAIQENVTAGVIDAYMVHDLVVFISSLEE